MHALQLAALRIPAGWEVVFNNFVEITDPAALDADQRDAYLSQDLLLLRSRGYVLDLGWRPDGDPAGSYRLAVTTAAGEDTAIKLVARSSAIVRLATELVLLGLAAGDTPLRIQAKLQQAAH